MVVRIFRLARPGELRELPCRVGQLLQGRGATRLGPDDHGDEEFAKEDRDGQARRIGEHEHFLANQRGINKSLAGTGGATAHR